MLISTLRVATSTSHEVKQLVTFETTLYNGWTIEQKIELIKLVKGEL
jgi:hypothetical protein